MYDIKNLRKMKNLEAHAPQAMKAFVVFEKAALAEGAIPRKYNEGVIRQLITNHPSSGEAHGRRI